MWILTAIAEPAVGVAGLVDGLGVVVDCQVWTGERIIGRLKRATGGLVLVAFCLESLFQDQLLLREGCRSEFSRTRTMETGCSLWTKRTCFVSSAVTAATKAATMTKRNML